MANEDHLKQLKKGVKNWNQWRKKNKNVKPDLSDAIIRTNPNINSTRIILAIAITILTTILTTGPSDITDIAIEVISSAIGIIISAIEVISSAIRNIIRIIGIISGASTIGVILTISIIGSADRFKKRFIMNFSNINFSDTNLKGADLRNLDFSYANLKGAELTGAKLHGINRTEWNIDGIVCDYVYWDTEGTERTPKDRDFHPGEFEELYKSTPLDNFERLIKRSIEFPEEYKQAGVGILNYFSEILRKKYPDSKAKIQIKQDGLKVTMIIDPADGEREIIEKALNDFGLVITGKMTPEEFTNDKLLILELKSQITLAKAQIENQKQMLEFQKVVANDHIEQQAIHIDKLFSLIGEAIQGRSICIDVSPTIKDIGNSKQNVTAGNDVSFAQDQATASQTTTKET